MNNNSIVHLHLYLYNDVLKKIAIENIKKIKSYGFKILITSGLPLPEEFYEFCDYIFIDHDNLQFKKKYKSFKPVNFYISNSYMSMNFLRNYQQKHALAVIHSIIKGCHLSKLLGYENIIKLVYDCELGVESANKIKEVVSALENNECEMIFYENIRSDIDGDNSDISGQILYYKVEPFLDIFKNVVSEEEYNRLSTDIGFGEIILDLETLLYRYLKKSTKKIKYLEENSFFTDYHDTQFNKVLSTKSQTDESGFLYDVGHFIEKSNHLNDRVSLLIYNQHYPQLNSVEFKVFNYNDELIDTKVLTVKEVGFWSFDVVNIDNVKRIETLHINSGIIKNYNIEMKNGLLEISVNGEEVHSNIMIH